MQFAFEMLQTHFNSCESKWLPEYLLFLGRKLANKLGQGQPLKRSATNYPGTDRPNYRLSSQMPPFFWPPASFAWTTHTKKKRVKRGDKTAIHYLIF